MPEGRTTITPASAVTSTLTELATRIDAAHRATDPCRTASLYMRPAKHRVEIGDGVADFTIRAANTTFAASKRSIAAPVSKAKTPTPRGEAKPTDRERLTVSDEESVRAGHIEKGRISKKGGAFHARQ